jgi:hypothetical protein
VPTVLIATVCVQNPILNQDFEIIVFRGTEHRNSPTNPRKVIPKNHAGNIV